MGFTFKQIFTKNIYRLLFSREGISRDAHAIRGLFQRLIPLPGTNQTLLTLDYARLEIGGALLSIVGIGVAYVQIRVKVLRPDTREGK